MNYRKAYLWVSAIGLLPVALSYGVAPEFSLNWLFGIAVEVPNEAHVFRAIMGLYLAMVALWILGATKQRFERPAFAVGFRLVSAGTFLRDDQVVGQEPQRVLNC